MLRNSSSLNKEILSKIVPRVRHFRASWNDWHARHDGARYQPRLHDLRHTFAVHRLTAWIKRGADLNRMIPALSA